jgi:predicted TIM-barrel fold metal-dependent hydrolase
MNTSARTDSLDDSSRTSLVDVHTHIYPEWYLDLLAERDRVPRIAVDADGRRSFVIFEVEDRPGAAGGRPFEASYWDIEHKLAFMDQVGITESWVSLGNPWLDPFSGSDSPDLARRVNAWFADLPERTESRCRGFGVLPSDEVGHAIEIASEIAASHLVGVIIGTRVCGLALDDGALEPLWAQLEGDGVPVLIHPSPGLGMDVLGGFGAPG